MLVWQGAGIGAALIPMILGFIAQWAVDTHFGSGYARLHSWHNAIAWTIGAVLVWRLGNSLAKKSGKLLIDPSTGGQVELKEQHTLFWIPMQYWAVIWIGASVVSMFR